jgi:hypothetical protein
MSWEEPMISAPKCWRRDLPKPKLFSLKEKAPDQPMLSNEVLDNLILIYPILINLRPVICNICMLRMNRSLLFLVLLMFVVMVFGSDGDGNMNPTQGKDLFVSLLASVFNILFLGRGFYF